MASRGLGPRPSVEKIELWTGQVSVVQEAERKFPTTGQWSTDLPIEEWTTGFKAASKTIYDCHHNVMQTVQFF